MKDLRIFDPQIEKHYAYKKTCRSKKVNISLTVTPFALKSLGKLPGMSWYILDFYLWKRPTLKELINAGWICVGLIFAELIFAAFV